MANATTSGAAPAHSLRVLLAYRGDIDTKGGAAYHMERAAVALRELGVEVEVSYETLPDVRGFDLIHAFNIWSPARALEQLRYLRGTGLPVVWQPIYLHWAETAWASRAVPIALSQPDPALRTRMLEELRAGRLVVNGMSRHAPNEIVPGFHTALREMLACVDHIVTISQREMQMLSQVTQLISKPYTVARLGIDSADFAGASPAAFEAATGLRDFVLCVGSLDGRKNQALLAEALRDSGLPLVLVGPCFEPDYRELVLASGGDRLVYLERLPRELVASAYKAAAVHVLPSFAEGSALANLEAAAAACPLVVSNRSSEFEYYGDLVYYCDPSDPVNIREAVRTAYERRHLERPRWQELAARMGEYTWERTAQAMLQAYERTLAGSGRALVPEARGFVTVSFAAELVGSPACLAAYAESFAAGDDATLVIVVDPADAAMLGRLEATVAAVGLGSDESVDMVASAVPEGGFAALAASADALLSDSAAPRALTGLPRFGALQAAELRRAAERRWTLAA